MLGTKNDIIMINNAFRNDIIKGVFKYIADQISCSCYMSADGKTVMKIFNLRYMSPEIVHYVYHKGDISLTDFLFKTDVYVYNDDPEKITHYSKWTSIVELWNADLRKISNEEFISFREKIEKKFKEFNEIV